MADIFKAVASDAFSTFADLFSTPPTKRDYALAPQGYQEDYEFVATEESKSVHVDEVIPDPVELCRVCKSEVKTMSFQGTGVCCILCEKEERFEITGAERHAIKAGLKVESGIK